MLFQKKRNKGLTLQKGDITFSFSIDKKESTKDLFREVIRKSSSYFEPTYLFQHEDFLELDMEDFSKKLKGRIYDSHKVQHMDFLYPVHRSGPFVIDFVVRSENIGGLEALINYLTGLDGFYAGYAYNREDHFLQNTDNPGFFRSRGIEVPPDKLIKNRYNDLRIDISKNPGRAILINKMWLMSAWQMWFGKQTWNLLDSQKVLSFPSALTLDQYPNYIYIKLYENHFEANFDENREIQKAFRDWVNMEQIIST